MHGVHARELATATLTIALLSLLAPPAARASSIGKRHVQLVTPTPFAWDEYGPTNPLRPDGSDYPCKIPHGDAFTIRTGAAAEVVAGEPQTVRFSGWAVHGGGSCQFALAEGHAPTPASAWKVIHSVEGGCPKANVTGNLAPGEDPDAYTFAVPEDFAPGAYTWAWTWVNRIAGEPEFYMNCAPITVKAAAKAAAATTAGSSSSSTARARSAGSMSSRRRRGAAVDEDETTTTTTTTTYPDLFLANIGSASNGCNTSAALYSQIAIAYPSPGRSVSRPNGAEELFPQPCDGNPRNNGAAPSVSGGGSSQLPSSAATTGGGQATGGAGAATTATAALPSSSSSSSSAGALTSSTPATTSALTPSPPSSSSAAAVSTTSSAAAGAATATGSATLDSPCTSGHLLCVGGTQFSTCTGGAWDAPQDLAANTTCEEEGESVGLDTTYHWS